MTILIMTIGMNNQQEGKMMDNDDAYLVVSRYLVGQVYVVTWLVVSQ